MFEQISGYIEKFLSPYLCGFRKGFSTQHSLIVMLEKWRKALDNNKLAGALLTDLSKAFDCLNHNLMIANCMHMVLILIPLLIFIAIYQIENTGLILIIH